MPYLKVEDNFSATIVGNYSTTASTITLSNVPVAVSAGWLTVYDFDGNQYEKIYFGGVSGSDITSVLRGLSFTTNSQTEISGNKKELKNGMTVKLSVSQNHINDLTDVVNGTKEVGGLMKNPSSRTITDNRHIIDKEYADNLAIAGAPKATEAVYGIAKLSSAAADPTAPVVVNNEEVSASGGTGAGENKIVKANASGYIDKDYIELGTDPGLEFVSNGLEAKIKTSGGLIKDANGLSADMGTTANKIVQLDSSAKLPAVDGSQLTNLPPQSNFQILGKLTQGGITMSEVAVATDTSNDSIYLAYNNPVSSNNTLIIFRLEKDLITGNYKKTHSFTSAITGGSYWGTPSMTVMGDYLYYSRSNSDNIYRVDKANLSNETTITYSGGSPDSSIKYLFNDGTNIYVYNRTGSYYIKKYSVSGSTFTFVSQITSSVFGSGVGGAWLDATNFYYGGESTVYIINRSTGVVTNSSVMPPKIEILANAKQSIQRVGSRVLSITSNNTASSDTYAIVYLDWFSSTNF